MEQGTMQRAPVSLDIDGHLVHTGSTVRVKWLGVWYEATVIKIGPKRDLCRVRDLDTNESTLCEAKHLQFTESRFMDKRISTGAHVVYNGGDQWREGVVDSKTAVGVIMASWRKSGLSEENLTWFELLHVAPVIHNELYEQHNRDLLEAGKSGLLHNDAIEPRPRTIDNMLYESESDQEEELLSQLAASKSSLAHKHTQKATQLDPPQKTQAVEEKSTEVVPPTLPLPSFPFHPAPMFMPMSPMMHPLGKMYLPMNQHDYTMKMSPTFMSAPGSFTSTLPHPRSHKTPGLHQSSVPCIISLTKPTNGIPPHPSSHFFKSLRNAKLGKRKLGKLSRSQAKSKLKKSPTAESKAYSEPTQYATIAELTDPMTKLTEKISKHEKAPTSTELTPSRVPSHHHTKRPPHTSQPPSTSPHLLPPHLPPPSKKLTSTNHTPRQEDMQIASPPPPLPPRPSKPLQRPVATDTASSTQTMAISEPSSQRNNANYVHVEQDTVYKIEQEMSEEEEEDGGLGYSDRDLHTQTQGDQGTSDLRVVSVGPADVTVAHGGSTLLTCVARSSRTVHYKWSRDGKPISEDDPFFTQPAPGMLQIQMAALSLSGEYRCVAFDNHSSLERVFHLKVYSGAPVSDQKRDGSQISSAAVGEQIAHTVESTENEVGSTQQQTNTTLPAIVVDEPQSEPTTPVTQQPESHDRTGPSTRGSIERPENDNDVATGQEVEHRRKTAKRNRRRVSNALKNDMEQYLEGYGENYGALSSQADLNPWLEDLSEGEGQGRKRRKRKGKKRKKKKSGSQGSSSPTKSSESPKKQSPKQPRKNVSFTKLPSALGGKNRKEQVKPEETAPHPSEAWKEERMPEEPRAEPVEEEMNSVAVHTSVGASSGSEVSVRGGEGEGGKLELPQEQESLNDSVRRLQLSVEEYCPEQIKFAEKEKKKISLSNIFPRNKLS